MASPSRIFGEGAVEVMHLDIHRWCVLCCAEKWQFEAHLWVEMRMSLAQLDCDVDWYEMRSAASLHSWGSQLEAFPQERQWPWWGQCWLQRNVLHYRSRTTLNILVTVSGIHSHSKISNWMKYTIITHVQGYQCCIEHKCRPYQHSHTSSPLNIQGFASLLPPIWE